MQYTPSISPECGDFSYLSLYYESTPVWYTNFRALLLAHDTWVIYSLHIMQVSFCMIWCAMFSDIDSSLKNMKNERNFWVWVHEKLIHVKGRPLPVLWPNFLSLPCTVFKWDVFKVRIWWKKMSPAEIHAKCICVMTSHLWPRSGC